MTLYELFTVYILPHIVDMTLFEGVAESVFYRIFVTTISIIIVHLFIVLPYLLMLKLIKYRPTWWWRRK